MLRSTLGLVSLVVGLIGLLLPFVPGIPFLILAWLLLRRGDRHWRRPRAWRDHGAYRDGYDSHRGHRMDDERDGMPLQERLRLRALQGTSRVLRQLERAEQHVRGQGSRLR
jgi:hypothetical protein